MPIPYVRPFYSLEYALAGAGALQIGRRRAEDPVGALSSYKALLKAGPDGTSAELFALAGATLVPTREGARELMAWVAPRAAT